MWILKVPWEYFCQALIALLDSDLKMWGAGYGNDAKCRLEDIYWERRAYRFPRCLNDRAPKWDLGDWQGYEGRMKLLMVSAVSVIATKPKDWKVMSITYENSAALVFERYVIYYMRACVVADY